MLKSLGRGFPMAAIASDRGGKTPSIFLKDHPEMAAEIDRAIRANAGLVAEEMLTGEEKDDEDEAAAG